MKAVFVIFVAVTTWLALAQAGDVTIEKVKIKPLGGDQYRFSVTLRHNDTGWDHYADLWQVLAGEDEVLGERVLAHPHENEQPFTRSAVIRVPQGAENLRVRAHDSVHGWAEEVYTVELPN